MRLLFSRFFGVALACVAGLGEGREADAQLFGGGIPNLAPDPTIQPMQGLASYRLGEPGAGAELAAAAAGVPSQGNFLNSPMAGPILYSTMMNNPAIFGGQAATTTATSTTTTAGSASAAANLQMTQLGLIWMMANQQNGGFGAGGSGQVRTASTSQAAPDNGRIRSRVQIRTKTPPAGRSARYFQRTVPRPSSPRSYFNRQPSYFP